MDDKSDNTKLKSLVITTREGARIQGHLCPSTMFSTSY